MLSNQNGTGGVATDHLYSNSVTTHPYLAASWGLNSTSDVLTAWIRSVEQGLETLTSPAGLSYRKQADLPTLLPVFAGPALIS